MQSVRSTLVKHGTTFKPVCYRMQRQIVCQVTMYTSHTSVSQVIAGDSNVGLSNHSLLMNHDPVLHGYNTSKLDRYDNRCCKPLGLPFGNAAPDQKRKELKLLLYNLALFPCQIMLKIDSWICYAN